MVNDHCYCQSLASPIAQQSIADVGELAGFVRDAVRSDGIAYYECASCFQWWREDTTGLRKVKGPGA